MVLNDGVWQQIREIVSRIANGTSFRGRAQVDREDAVSHVVARIAQRLSQMSPPCASIRNYIARSAKPELQRFFAKLDQHRRRAGHAPAEATTYGDIADRTTTSPLDTLIRREELDMIENAIPTLPERERVEILRSVLSETNRPNYYRLQKAMRMLQASVQQSCRPPQAKF